jgi:hypothetical protein
MLDHGLALPDDLYLSVRAVDLATLINAFDSVCSSHVHIGMFDHEFAFQDDFYISVRAGDLVTLINAFDTV